MGCGRGGSAKFGEFGALLFLGGGGNHLLSNEKYPGSTKNVYPVHGNAIN